MERKGKPPLTARFDGIPLRQKKNAVLIDHEPIPVTARRKELANRLLAGRCEMCKHTGSMEVHHVSKLAELTTPGQPQPAWAALMAQRRRKTLVVCSTCHDTIHHRQPTTHTK